MPYPQKIMKPTLLLNFVCATLLCCVNTPVCGQTQEARPEYAFFSEDHGAETFRALSAAFDQNRKDLLLIGLDNPNIRVREAAAKKICELPNVDPKDGFITVLQKDSLWIEAIEGSRNISMQRSFVDDVKKRIQDRFHINASNIDLFDIQARAGLIKQIRQTTVE